VVAGPGSDTVNTNLDEAFLAMHRLEDSVNELTFAAGEQLRNAVRRFNSEPLSVSSVDVFRERVLQIADALGRPLQMPDLPPAGASSSNLRVVETLRVVR
jgi:hypothetical protein